MNYTKLCQEFADYECRLLTTEEEIKEQIKNRSITIHHAKVKILAECGHEQECVVTNFLQRRTAVMCKDCRLKSINTKMKESSINNHEIEYRGYKDIKLILEEYYHVEKSKEGCLADFMIRPKCSTTDQWIGIQLKVTTKMSFGMYTFRKICNSYDDLLIFCYCLEEQKLWILPYLVIKNLKFNLNISEYSKYNKYLITNNTKIPMIIDSYRNSYQYFTKEELLLPTSLQQQQEQTYARRRELKCPFIEFTYPEIENGKTDFYIGNLKIQEKVSSLYRNKNVIVLCVHNGTIDKKRQYRSYQWSDNDFYWVNIKNSSNFYVIPEMELYKRNFISSKDTYINRVNIYIDSNDWLFPYLFDYENLDKERKEGKEEQERLKILLGI